MLPPLAPAHPGYWLVGILGTALLVAVSPKLGGAVLLVVVLVLLLAGQQRGTLPWER